MSATYKYILDFVSNNSQFLNSIGQSKKGVEDFIKKSDEAKNAVNKVFGAPPNLLNKSVDQLSDRSKRLTGILNQMVESANPQRFKRLNDELVRTNSILDQAKSKIGATKQPTESLLGNFKGIAGAVGLAFGVREIGAFSLDLVKLGGEAEGVQAAFNKIADARDLANLRDSVHGTVSDLELMKRAVSAQNFGIPVKELGNLFAFATKRAQDTGQSVDYLVDSIVTGIGRKSPLILDNLGISATALKDKMHGVAIESASVGEITKAVGEIAADSFKKTGDILDTNAIKLQQVAAGWENVKKGAADLFNNSEWLANDLNSWSQLFEIWQSKEISGWGKFWSSVSQASADAATKAIRDNEMLKNWLNQKEEESYDPRAKTPETLNTQAKSFQELNEKLKDYNTQLAQIAPNDEAAITAKLQQIIAIEKQIKAVDELKKKIEDSQRTITDPMYGQKMVQIMPTWVNNGGFNLDAPLNLDGEPTGLAIKKQDPIADFIKQQQDLRDEMQKTEEIGKAVGQTVGDAFTQFGQRAIESFGLASTGMEGFVGNMLSGITELMGMLLANAIGNAIVSGSLSASFSGPGAVFTLPAFIAAGVASVMGAFAAIPAFADGGIVYGPTMGLMGEYPGARSNPEVIAPLSKLQAMISRSGNDRPIILQPSVDFTGDKMRVMLNMVENKRLKRVGK